MAKNRIVNTRFWIDDYTSNLDPIEKLLFLYFLTNTATEICGVYEIPLKTVAVETGIDKETVENIIKRFSKDKKIFYIDGWVYVVNFTKHQVKNPSVEQGIKRGLSEVPNKILQSVHRLLPVSPQSDALNLTKLNLTKPKGAEQSSTGNHELIIEIIKKFETINPNCKRFYKNTTQREACINLIDIYGFDEVIKVVGLLLKTNNMKYMPTITTPVQLRDKYESLKSNLLKAKDNKLKIII